MSYARHLFTSTGLKADPTKVTDIREKPRPEDKVALQHFLGMINYLGKFIPNLSEPSTPLCQLLHKDVVWSWAHHQQDAFDKFRTCVTRGEIDADREGATCSCFCMLQVLRLYYGKPVVIETNHQSLVTMSQQAYSA